MNSYPKYQFSTFLGGRDEQLVIRADSWEEFLELKKNANAIINKKKADQPSTDSKTLCTECNAPMRYKEGVSKTGKAWKGYFCTKCKNVSWVR